MTQHVIEITSPVFMEPTALAQCDSLDSLFAHKRPLALEIGCGTGDFIVQRARQFPDVNHIVIDIYNKGCLKTCKRVERYGLDNVRVIRIEARYLLSQFSDTEALRAVYINCPDPWPKKRHRRRRLVSRRFLTQLAHYLEPGGDLYFVTDVEDYALEVAMTLEEMPEFLNQLKAPMAYELDEYPISRYMRRFKEQNLPIHYIHRQLDPAAKLQRAHMPALELSFRCQQTETPHPDETQSCSNI
ncbi:MAG: tRNA (guanosine(46)-N7)-methyltransferase TrmB [Desulfuromonadaceae bacterium]|nr:tRNA (guanosine(46)-N7)-methyltransferase TrmB [Desulfuromonas sp.]MDY0213841.1 tRNA (guanosine(46)-N7)-methyltransferase TrmB [Desulfuromonadaceae bacterium]